MNNQNSEELNNLLEQAKELFANIPPEDQRLENRDNAIDLVFAMFDSDPRVTRELVERAYDETH